MKSSIVTIRDAGVTDVPAIVRMLADDPIGAMREDTSDRLLSSYRSAFDDIAADPNNRILLAELDGMVVGCVQITIIPGLSYRGATRALIEDVRVDTSHRRKRIGARLIDAAERFARERGCKLLELFVHSNRAQAHDFYESLGYAGQHRGFRKNLAQENER